MPPAKKNDPWRLAGPRLRGALDDAAAREIERVAGEVLVAPNFAPGSVAEFRPPTGFVLRAQPRHAVPAAVLDIEAFGHGLAAARLHDVGGTLAVPDSSLINPAPLIAARAALRGDGAPRVRCSVYEDVSEPAAPPAARLWLVAVGGETEETANKLDLALYAPAARRETTWEEMFDGGDDGDGGGGVGALLARVREDGRAARRAAIDAAAAAMAPDATTAYPVEREVLDTETHVLRFEAGVVEYYSNTVAPADTFLQAVGKGAIDVVELDRGAAYGDYVLPFTAAGDPAANPLPVERRRRLVRRMALTH